MISPKQQEREKRLTVGRGAGLDEVVWGKAIAIALLPATAVATTARREKRTMIR
jgi:hypothetical protein